MIEICRSLCRGHAPCIRTVLTLVLAFLPYVQQSVTGQETTVGDSGQGIASAPIQVESPLHRALATRRYDEALAEMKLVLDIDAIDPVERSTALCIAARDETADAIDMVQALVLKYGADPNIPDGQGIAPLHYASATGNLAVVQFLVTHGAEINLEVGDGTSITPLFMAYRNGRNRIAEYLKSFGANEVEDSIRMDLEVEAAVSQAMRDFPMHILVERLEEGESPNALIGALVSTLSKAAVGELDSQGRHDVAENYRSAIKLLPEVLDGMPKVGDDVDPGQFVGELVRSIFEKLTSHSATPSEGRREEEQ